MLIEACSDHRGQRLTVVVDVVDEVHFYASQISCSSLYEEILLEEVECMSTWWRRHLLVASGTWTMLML